MQQEIQQSIHLLVCFLNMPEREVRHDYYSSVMHAGVAGAISPPPAMLPKPGLSGMMTTSGQEPATRAPSPALQAGTDSSQQQVLQEANS